VVIALSPAAAAGHKHGIGGHEFAGVRAHEQHQFADFLEALGEGKQAAPTFRDGLATDYVTDAVLESARTGRWENVGSADVFA